MCGAVLNVFDCSEYDGDYLLDLDPDIRCFTMDDAAWSFMVASAIPLFLVYLTSAPTLIMFLNLKQSGEDMKSRMELFSTIIRKIS